MPLVLGLTGGIGSGKSTVAKIFEVLGVKVYSSDQRAKDLYFKESIKPRVTALLGEEAYADEHTLNRMYIARKIFSDTDLLQKINALIHHEVKLDFEQFRQKHAAEKYIVKESALLVEAGLLDSVDKLLVVTADEETRIQRVVQRDRISVAEVKKRMGQQLTDAEKMKHATWIVANNEMELIIPRVLEIHQKMMA